MNARITDPLPAARRQLADAISSLIDRHTETDTDGKQHYVPSHYRQLLDELAGTTSKLINNRQARSLPCLWIDAHDQLNTINQTVATWHPELPAQNPRNQHNPTERRLHAIDEKTWRPQDCKQLYRWAKTITIWVKDIKQLLTPERHIYLTGDNCPACDQNTITATSKSGEEVRRPALLITPRGAECQACGTTWEPWRLALLGKQLGRPTPTGVIE